ncbi:tRNA-dihydrouridine synthase [Candidatus Kaiserbacteria bacterium CG_4_8_14_3_um_filter_38_9]|uniref:tRNA-dihydrouridine synthase n=1 Tax=Candidatus Kaiserbacteria bacterium CG_4_8_14_3_um_filter_38_9 TaxID=1974599 RepID=A0A2M7INC5_9BACT|nr:MAG: tRNA-dihydrouridine synthase [Candidatus Kaiserbacteria bacterium CG_4_8_14_3_um_filter_38_9]
MKDFWQLLPTPFFVLAPMADVTDAAFRKMIAKYSAHERADGTKGGPDVMWTEFVAADGLVLATKAGQEKLLADLIYHKEERPIVAQLFSSHEDNMEKASSLCLQLGFDGIDINMGCPDKTIEKQGCGAAMIKNPVLARAIIRAAKRGAENDKGGIPISVKTRLGYNRDQVEEWIPEILAERPSALIIHARTRKEMSKVPARWEQIARVVELRNELSPETKIIGNGDVSSLADARQKASLSGADGVMLGRAIFGNPWFFHPEKSLMNISLEKRLEVMIEHTYLFSELLPHKSFSLMKKHYKAYVYGFSGAVELRTKLMEQETPEAVEAVVHVFLANQLKIL